MKTEEDEAFEDIERRQGGFQAKRAMAADKLQEFCTCHETHPMECQGCRANRLAQPVQEPVAWAIYDKRGGSKSLHWSENHSPDGDATKFDAVPLYTSPPQREWVGLTNERIKELFHKYGTSRLDGFTAAIQEALAQPEYDYKDLYEKEKRKSAMWLAKYEEVAGPAPKAYPVAQPVQEPVTEREALKLALEALKEAQTNDDGMEKWDRNKKAITVIKEALAQPAQEQWNAALDEAASRIAEIKGFGQATQDSFAVFIKGLKK